MTAISLADVVKAYDVRGTVPDQLDERVTRALGAAFADVVILDTTTSGATADAAPTPADAGLLVAYPAHLHVDLLPRLQGQGWGRRVVESVLAGLTAAGATGVHLGVDQGNTGAQQFYLRLGFTELEGPPGARYYGMDLGSRSR